MNNDRFFNAYVEILTTTLHDALNKNIVYQAQAKIAGEDTESYKEEIEKLQSSIEEYEDIQKIIEEKEHELLDKNAEIGRLQSDFENTKNENSHLNTFKNELMVARQEIKNKINEINILNSKIEKEKTDIISAYEKKIESLNVAKEKEIKELKNKIEYLQMTPAQRRKFDSKNEIKKEENSKDNSKDGGTF